MSKGNMFAARPDSPKCAWLIFFRPKPKQLPQLVHVAGNLAEALIASAEAAKQLKVPRGKIEIVMYVPVGNGEKLS